MTQPHRCSKLIPRYTVFPCFIFFHQTGSLQRLYILEYILVVPMQMLGKGVDTDAADLVQLLQQMKTLGSAVAVKGCQIGEGYPFNGFLWNNALIYLLGLGNQVGEKILFCLNASGICTDAVNPAAVPITTRPLPV
jgi:hypothetical protein